MRKLIVILFLILSWKCYSKIDSLNFDQKYLEHLVKTKIDSIRTGLGLKALVNDSVLYVASLHHANYMAKESVLSHFEDDKKETYSPQLRAEYFGAKNYLTGENVLRSTRNRLVKSKDGKIFNTESYEGLANSIISGWVNSPGHYKNLITPDYQITGVSVVLGENGAVYACQKFARVLFKYSFDESKSFFPYSNYEPELVPTSFKGIERDLIKQYAYDWGLTHDSPLNCAGCDTLVKNKPGITCRYEDGNFILRVENSKYVSDLIHDKFDGFAIEIVQFDDYMCGNPAYYVKPSRRNGQIKLNGTILMPKYRKDLLSGYKVRKRNKEVKFIPYLFGEENVKLVNRFAHYKVDKYSSEYFEIRLGRLPNNIEGNWQHNLVYIQNKQICHIDYFTGYCSELFDDSVQADFIPPDTGSNYIFEPEYKTIDFIIPFEQGKSEFGRADIDPFLLSLSDVSYEIDSILIHAYSSVEGDSVINHNLQEKRASNIVKILLENQEDEALVTVKTSTAWSEFRRDVKRIPEWSHLAGASESEITSALTGNAINDLESVLSKERRAEIRLYTRIPFSDKNLEYYLKRDFRKIETEIQKSRTKKISEEPWLDQFQLLYQYVYTRTAEGRLPASYIASIKMPLAYQKNPSLVETFALVGHTYYDEFRMNKIWMTNHVNDLNLMMTKYLAFASSKTIYNGSLFSSRSLQHLSFVEQERIQAVLDNMMHLQYFYNSDSVAMYNIENISFNMNMLLLNKVFALDPAAKSKEAQICISQIYQFYVKRGRMNNDIALKLGRASVFFSNHNAAIFYLEPFSENDEVLDYLVPLYFRHPSEAGSEGFYQWLIDLSNQMDTPRWCNLFINECKIPFQAFDHQELRDVFCEKCMEENDFLKKLAN